MALRNVIHIFKNSDIVNRPLPSSLQAGEPIVNTADGIMYFSGVTTSTNEWTPAGTGTTANFFEVGSNLYDLRLRNRITQYEGVSGAGLVGKFLSGTTNGFVLADISSIQGVDSYVTGGTFNNATDTLTLNLNEGKPDVNITGITDFYTTGATLIGSTAYFDRNDTLSAFTLDLSSLDVNDTFLTGFTYNPTNNRFTINRNDGTDFTTTIETVSGLSVSNLTAGRVVYVGTGGSLVDEAGFGYNAGTDTLSVGNVSVTNDVTINGNLTVLGAAISAFTGELYIEDNNVILNYNPTGVTNISSINAGFTIQDGDGASNDVSYDIVRMANLTGITATQIPDVSEYVGTTGYANRGWITELNDIVIRSTDVTDDGTAGSITGVRVLAEFDTLDGGTY